MAVRVSSRLVCSGRSPQVVPKNSPTAFQLREFYDGTSQEWVLVGDLAPPEPAPRRFSVPLGHLTRGWIGTTILFLLILGIIAFLSLWG